VAMGESTAGVNTLETSREAVGTFATPMNGSNWRWLSLQARRLFLGGPFLGDYFWRGTVFGF
jgi:hypothetical protein